MKQIFFYFFWHFVNISLFCKPGGLDSRDQSRLRTSLVSRKTFLKCQDFLDGWDQLFFSWLRFLKLRLFSWEFDVLRFLSRLLRRVAIVKICRDLRNLDIVEAFWVWKLWNVSTYWEISTRKYTHFLTEIQTNCQKRQKFSDLDKFLDLKTKSRSLDLNRRD